MYYQPNSLADLNEFLTRANEHMKFLAGGTDLVVQMKTGELSPTIVVDLKSVPEFSEIDLSKDGFLRIGALSTANDIIESELLGEYIPKLAEIAENIGSVQIRNRATIGGNICRAAPSADFAPLLIALKAQVEILSENKIVTEELDTFFVGPGRTILKDEEIVSCIVIPKPVSNQHVEIQRISLRKTMDLALVGTAVSVEIDDLTKKCSDVRIVLGSVGPTPMRMAVAEQEVYGNILSSESIDAAAKKASENCKPISDIYGSVWYKRKIVEVLVRRALENIQKKVGLNGR